MKAKTITVHLADSGLPVTVNIKDVEVVLPAYPAGSHIVRRWDVDLRVKEHPSRVHRLIVDSRTPKSFMTQVGSFLSRLRGSNAK